jgi:hypothetical protein
MSSNSCVLLIAERDDAEATLVAESLSAYDAEVFWVDTADFPGSLGLIGTPGSGHPGWLCGRSGKIDLALVHSIYRRSPALFCVEDGMSAPEPMPLSLS